MLEVGAPKFERQVRTKLGLQREQCSIFGMCSHGYSDELLTITQQRLSMSRSSGRQHLSGKNYASHS